MKKPAQELLQLLASGVTHNGLTMWAYKHKIILQSGGGLQDRIKYAAREVSK